MVLLNVTALITNYIDYANSAGWGKKSRGFSGHVSSKGQNTEHRRRDG